MFATLALAAIIVTNPAHCPASAPWAQPAGEVGYVCTADDPGETNPNPGHKPAPAPQPTHTVHITQPAPEPRPTHTVWIKHPVKHHVKHVVKHSKR